MSKFFAPNLSRAGRILRTVWGVLLFGLGILLFSRTRWGCFVLCGAGAFALFEAMRGWCIMRACGIKTRL